MDSCRDSGCGSSLDVYISIEVRASVRGSERRACRTARSRVCIVCIGDGEPPDDRRLPLGHLGHLAAQPEVSDGGLACAAGVLHERRVEAAGERHDGAHCLERAERGHVDRVSDPHHRLSLVKVEEGEKVESQLKKVLKIANYKG